MPARARVAAVFSTSSFIATMSASLNPILRMSRASREGFPADDFDRVVPAGLEDSCRAWCLRRARAGNTTMSRTTFCSARVSVIRLARTGPMPGTSRRRSRLGLDDVERLVVEGLHQLVRADPADVADHARAQVLLDALGR